MFAKGLLNLWIIQRFLEKRVAEKRAELPIAGEVLQRGFIDDDGAWIRAAGLWIDDGFEVF